VIRVAGASVHNLKDVSLEIPTGRITVFTGVSGSGKSSLAFDTIGVEAQRQLNSTFPWIIRNQLPKYERPVVDTIENLGTPVLVDQKPLGGGARSTVGTVTDIMPVIRTLFARIAAPALGRPAYYSFNNPLGMCPDCDGLGEAVRLDLDLMLDRSKSLNQGAVLFPEYKVGSPDFQIWANSGRYDAHQPLKDFTQAQWADFLTGTGGKVTVRTKNTEFATNYEGMESRFTRLYLNRDLSTLSEKKRELVQKYLTTGRCPACEGTRLNEAARGSRVGGRNIAEWGRLEINDLLVELDSIDDPVGSEIARVTRTALRRLVDVGLGYLTLDRATDSLSGGESQRLKLVRHLGSTLVGMLYLFDEPSTGLHPHDVSRVNALLRELSDQGNTVLVIEHDPDVITAADHVVDLGPGAGSAGGQVVFQGDVEQLRAADTVTGRALAATPQLSPSRRAAHGSLSVTGATVNNLQNVSVDFPTGVLTVVTGVAGSGKSSLVQGVLLARHPEAVFVDQSAIAASSRSTPATYLGVMDPIRKLFADAGGVSAGLFSFNSKGACEECEGRGVIITELAYMDPVTTSCESCGGSRFTESVLGHRLRGRSIAEVLDLSAQEAVSFFTEKPVVSKLQPLVDVGVGYLSLGQSLSTLSGGERQRLKLASELHRKGDLFVFDEPTTGLHMADVATLLAVLDGLVDRGNTVIVVEHNLDVIRHADWIIDLGPYGGNHGGQVVFTGTPEDLLSAEGSLTATHLKRYLGSLAPV
jgi:excinuclease UvrABC ATPase subunit